MIGQKNLITLLQDLIYVRLFPHFVILTGQKGSGKKTLAKYIAAKVSENVIMLDNLSVDSIRGMIEQCHKIKDLCYIIPDADTMSAAAKNAMLKVTEEPPNNSTFIMTLEDAQNTFDTIRSRASVFAMLPYSKDELMEYIEKYKLSEKQTNLVLSACDTPGEIDTVVANDVLEFFDYVKLVADNIAEVSGANAFKIPSKVALKDTDDGYDLKMFWKLYMNYCMQFVISNKDSLENQIRLRWIGITGRYIADLSIKGINRQMLMDNWILDIRKEALDGAE